MIRTYDLQSLGEFSKVEDNAVLVRGLVRKSNGQAAGKQHHSSIRAPSGLHGTP